MSQLNLTDHFLIAMPAMGDPYFAKSLVYLLHHDEEGTFGVIVNKPVATQLTELIPNLSDELERGLADQSAFFGGPVSKEQGFVLHTEPFEWEQSMHSDSAAITSSLDVLEAIAQHRGPEHFLLTLGYSGWGPQQLEEEIRANAWLPVAADREILFHTDPYKKYDLALKKLGIDPAMMSSSGGNA